MRTSRIYILQTPREPMRGWHTEQCRTGNSKPPRTEPIFVPIDKNIANIEDAILDASEEMKDAIKAENDYRQCQTKLPALGLHKHSFFSNQASRKPTTPDDVLFPIKSIIDSYEHAIPVLPQAEHLSSFLNLVGEFLTFGVGASKQYPGLPRNTEAELACAFYGIEQELELTSNAVKKDCIPIADTEKYVLHWNVKHSITRTSNMEIPLTTSTDKKINTIMSVLTKSLECPQNIDKDKIEQILAPIILANSLCERRVGAEIFGDPHQYGYIPTNTYDRGSTVNVQAIEDALFQWREKVISPALKALEAGVPLEDIIA